MEVCLASVAGTLMRSCFSQLRFLGFQLERTVTVASSDMCSPYDHGDHPVHPNLGQDRSGPGENEVSAVAHIAVRERSSA